MGRRSELLTGTRRLVVIGWPMGAPEFLRIPNLRNLTWSRPSPARASVPHKHADGGSELPSQPDPRRPLSSATCADHAGEVLPALGARIRRREKWRGAHSQGRSVCRARRAHRMTAPTTPPPLRPPPGPLHAAGLGPVGAALREADCLCPAARRVFLELRVDCRIAPPVEHRRCRRHCRRRRLDRLVLPSLRTDRGRHDPGRRRVSHSPVADSPAVAAARRPLARVEAYISADHAAAGTGAREEKE